MIELSESDIFGNLTLKVNSEEEFKDQYYAKRPNVILRMIFCVLLFIKFSFSTNLFLPGVSKRIQLSSQNVITFKLFVDKDNKNTKIPTPNLKNVSKIAKQSLHESYCFSFNLFHLLLK